MFPFSKGKTDSNNFHDFELNASPAEDLSETHDSTKGNYEGVSKKSIQKRKKYHKIDDNIRMKLVEAVEKNGEMLKTAAHRYGINYSSAKSIFHTYRKEGRIIKKVFRDRSKREPQSSRNIPLKVSINLSKNEALEPRKVIEEPEKLTPIISLDLANQLNQIQNLMLGFHPSTIFNLPLNPIHSILKFHPSLNYAPFISPCTPTQNPIVSQIFQPHFNQIPTLGQISNSDHINTTNINFLGANQQLMLIQAQNQIIKYQSL